MPNRLAAEKSPYLRQHADNPVDWLPWGEEALARAQRGGKPIFLSIGYSTCHWCHVMAHESFEHAAVAEVLNREFVPVKVDREERPDLDRVYMNYVQHTTGHGGWPMSVWLTPEGKPFYGGTYFPRDDREGRPGFITVLKTIAGHWRDQRARIEQGADEVVQTLREAGRGEAAPAGEAAPLHEAAGDAFEQAFQHFYDTHDTRWGGFGGAPKFPRASVLDFLLRSAALQGVETDIGQAAIGVCAVTVQRMAEGGIHDIVGGGFHRYAVDEQWHVPHFEKMLPDQALIAMNYLEVKQATGLPVFGWVARGIFDYVGRDLTAPGGGFYSAEDADSLLSEAPRGDARKQEGAFYVWTKAELDAALGDDAEFFCSHFDVKAEGNVAHDPHGEFAGRNVLRQLRPLARTAERCGLEVAVAEQKLLASLEKLRALRARRPRPHRDEKVIAAWNGLMISAFARGARGLQEPAYLRTATRAAEFLQRELYDAVTGTLYRSWCEGRGAIAGFAEDYAAVIQGLLDLYEAGFEVRWLQWAEKLQGRLDADFWDGERGGYFGSAGEDRTVVVRMKEDYDGAEPAANSIAAMNLVRFDWMLGTAGAKERAQRTIEALRSRWTQAPHALPQLLCAVELSLAEPRTVVIAGKPGARDVEELASVVGETLAPRRVMLLADAGEGQRWLASRRGYLESMTPIEDLATAYVCENFTCRMPVTTPAALRASLGS